MKVKVLHIILLLMICSIGCAQNKSMKIEKNNNSYYLVDKGHRFKVDPTILIAKPKHNAILNNDIKRNSISSTGFVKISVPDSVELKKYVSYLEKTGEFENIEYNSYYSPSLTTNDPYYETQWYMGSINIQDAWNITTGSSSTILS